MRSSKVIGIRGTRYDKKVPMFIWRKTAEKLSKVEKPDALPKSGRTKVSSALAAKKLRKAEEKAIASKYKTVTPRLNKNSFLLREKNQVANTINIPQIA